MILDRVDRVAKAIIQSLGGESLSDEEYLEACEMPEEHEFIQNCREAARIAIAEAERSRVLQ